MSARRPLVTVCRSAGLSMTWPMARMSAVVSVMITSITMNIETIAPTANVGRPKWNGSVSWTMLCVGDPAEVGHAERDRDDRAAAPGPAGSPPG